MGIPRACLGGLFCDVIRGRVGANCKSASIFFFVCKFDICCSGKCFYAWQLEEGMRNYEMSGHVRWAC